MARLFWQVLYCPMAVVWVLLCVLHTVLIWPVRGMERLLAALAPGILAVAWRSGWHKARRSSRR